MLSGTATEVERLGLGWMLCTGPFPAFQMSLLQVSFQNYEPLILQKSADRSLFTGSPSVPSTATVVFF